VEKYDTARQARDDSMAHTLWITKATNIESEYAITLIFHGYNGFANAPPCYVIRTWPIFFSIYVLHVVTCSPKIGSVWMIVHSYACRLYII